MGVTHLGSMYLDDSLSRRRGSVGDEGNTILRVWKSSRSFDSASDEARSGSLPCIDSSMAGMKSSREYGAVKSTSQATNEGQSVPSIALTYLDISRNNLSVMLINSSRFVYVL